MNEEPGTTMQGGDKLGPLPVAGSADKKPIGNCFAKPRPAKLRSAREEPPFGAVFYKGTCRTELK
jgi:hypothetical protein